MRHWLCCLWLLCVATNTHAALVINEVLYDPDGRDSGVEWIELYNTGPWPATLEGLSLDAGDGARPGRWIEQWRGHAGEWIAAGGWCWIGGPLGGRPPDVSCTLTLGNGPDAVRLLREGLELDRVGWGSLTWEGSYEGHPTPTTHSGRTLARRVDGVDSDDNQADFTEDDPSPGLANRPRCDLAVHLIRPGRALPVPRPSGALYVNLVVENRGRRALGAADVRLTVEGRSVLPDASLLADSLREGAVVTMPWRCDLAATEGVQSWVCFVTADDDEKPENDRDTLKLWVGPSPLAVSEIAPRPDSGGTEWVELAVQSREPLPLEGWSLEDHGGTRLVFAAPRAADPGTFLVAARDSAALHLDTPSRVIHGTGGWPLLNDTAADGGAADTLFLRDPWGRITDWAAYAETPRGATWIRVAAAPPGSGLAGWTAGPMPGSPGRPNPVVRAAASEPTRIGSTPRGVSLRRELGGVWIGLPQEAMPGDWRARVINLAGEIVWTARGHASDRVDCWTRWDGRTASGSICPAGVYLVEVTVQGEDGRDRIDRGTLVVGR